MVNKKKYIIIIMYVLFILSLILLITLLTILINWNKDNKKTDKQVDEINDMVKIREIEKEDDNVENVNPPVNNVTSDYWYYIGMNLLDVDFNNLIEKNSDTVAWLNVGGTNINYPVVQTSDNDYYLKHSFKKEYTDAGWVFMDYRNNKDFNNKNTIIYGHSRLNKTMFGSLKNVITNNWFNKKENHIVRISTPSYNYLYQVFSTYKIETENYYLTTEFTNEEYMSFLENIKRRSVFKYDVALNENDKIITLSTCSSNNTKIVLHAKLIKLQKK